MLIELAGIDGSGKSSVTDGLRTLLRRAGHQAVYERAVRSDARNLMAAVAVSRPDSFTAREREIVVLLDAARQARAELSLYLKQADCHALVTGFRCTLAARLAVAGLAEDEGLLALHDLIPQPDLSLLLTLPVSHALQRIRARAKQDGVLVEPHPEETLASRQNALEYAAGRMNYPVRRIDAAAPLTDVVTAAAAAIRELLDSSRVASNAP